MTEIIDNNTKCEIKKLTPNIIGSGLRIGIISARFNELVVDNLVQGALDALLSHGIHAKDITRLSVPGAFEIGFASLQLARLKTYDALIALGAVIRGSTSHYDYVCSQAASGITKVSLEEDIPIAFGILTTDTVEQALDRAGLKLGNKGYEAAMVAIELANLKRSLKEQEL